MKANWQLCGDGGNSLQLFGLRPFGGFVVFCQRPMLRSYDSVAKAGKAKKACLRKESFPFFPLFNKEHSYQRHFYFIGFTIYKQQYFL
jgi:hypothetical protein